MLHFLCMKRKKSERNTKSSFVKYFMINIIILNRVTFLFLEIVLRFINRK